MRDGESPESPESPMIPPDDAADDALHVSSLRAASRSFSQRRLLNGVSLAVAGVLLVALALHWLPNVLSGQLNAHPTGGGQTIQRDAPTRARHKLAHYRTRLGAGYLVYIQWRAGVCLRRLSSQPYRVLWGLRRSPEHLEADSDACHRWPWLSGVCLARCWQLRGTFRWTIVFLRWAAPIVIPRHSSMTRTMVEKPGQRFPCQPC